MTTTYGMDEDGNQNEKVQKGMRGVARQIFSRLILFPILEGLIRGIQATWSNAKEHDTARLL